MNNLARILAQARGGSAHSGDRHSAGIVANDHASWLGRVSRQLETNGVLVLLRALPFSSVQARNLCRLGVLSGLALTIREKLGVNLLHAGSIADLQGRIEKAWTDGMGKAIVSTPKVRGTELARFANLGAIMKALAEVGVNPMSPTGGAQLRSLLASLRPPGQEAHKERSMPQPDFETLTKFRHLSAGLQTGLVASANRQSPGSVRLIPSVDAGTFRAVLPRLSSDLRNVSFPFPTTDLLARFNILSIGALALGSNISDPACGSKAFAAAQSLKASGICDALRTAPIDFERLHKINAVATDINLIKSKLGFDLRDRDAPDRLIAYVEQARTLDLGEATPVGIDTLKTLSQLAEIGVAVDLGTRMGLLSSAPR